jgi:uncharacterized protein
MPEVLLLALRSFFPLKLENKTRPVKNAGRVKRDNTAFDVEWDESKNRLNQRKHNISFEEAATVFIDPLEVTIDDPAHAISEHRFISIGQSFRGRLLVVSYTERASRIRIITARKPTRLESRAYGEA